MKKLTFLLNFITPFLSFAQSASILPNAVTIPKVATLATCNTTERGKQVFNTTDNKMYFCDGTNWQEMTGGGFTLPYTGTITSSNPVLSIGNNGIGRGIYAKSINNAAIYGESSQNIGVLAISNSSVGVYGFSSGSNAGYFESHGDVSALFVYSHKNNAASFLGKVRIDGELTVDNNKGIVRSNSSTQQKIVRRNSNFHVTNLSPGAYADGTIVYESFGDLPTVTVGQVSNGTGDWYKVAVIPFNTTNNSCQVRVVNTSNTNVTMTGTWHFLIVGPE